MVLLTPSCEISVRSQLQGLSGTEAVRGGTLGSLCVSPGHVCGVWQLWPGGRGPPPCPFPVLPVLSPVLCQQQGEFRAPEIRSREWDQLLLILGVFPGHST